MHSGSFFRMTLQVMTLELPPSSRHLGNSLPRSTEAVLELAQRLAAMLYVGFSFNVSPICESFHIDSVQT